MILRYPGSKYKIASQIAWYIPKECTYVEPYFGSGSVLFASKQHKIEMVNDIDDNVVNFFRVLRDSPSILAEKILLTPYSRTEFNTACGTQIEDSIERARSFAIRCFMNFGSSTKYRYIRKAHKQVKAYQEGHQ